MSDFAVWLTVFTTDAAFDGPVEEIAGSLFCLMNPYTTRGLVTNVFGLFRSNDKMTGLQVHTAEQPPRCLSVDLSEEVKEQSCLQAFTPLRGSKLLCILLHHWQGQYRLPAEEDRNLG